DRTGVSAPGGRERINPLGAASRRSCWPRGASVASVLSSSGSSTTTHALCGIRCPRRSAWRAIRSAERLGHRMPQRAWVVVLEPDDDKTEATLAPRGQQDRLDAAPSGLIRSRPPGALTPVRSASAVFLVPDELAADLPAVEKLAAQVLSAAAPVMKPGSASVGIGNLAN